MSIFGSEWRRHSVEQPSAVSKPVAPRAGNENVHPTVARVVSASSSEVSKSAVQMFAQGVSPCLQQCPVVSHPGSSKA